MRKTALQAALVLLFTSHATASDLKYGQQCLDAALSAYRDAEDQLKAEMLKSHSAEYVSQHFISEAPLEKLAHFGNDFLEIADAHPRTEIAWTALQQVAYAWGFSRRDKQTASKRLIENHSSRERFYKDVYYHHYRPGVDAIEFSRLILDAKDVAPKIVGVAKFTLATGLSGVLNDAESIAPAQLDEVQELLTSIQQDYAALPHPNQNDPRTLGEAAVNLEFFINHLLVGKKAPPTTGKDVSGNTIQLSDYRGNVTLLVFCGEWCAPCRAIVPYEKEWLREFGDQGFAILGINSDPKETLEAAIEREQYPWKWILDGGSIRGPIATSWCIDRWPSFVLIDREGTVRKKKFTGSDTKQRAATIRAEIQQLLVPTDTKK